MYTVTFSPYLRAYVVHLKFPFETVKKFNSIQPFRQSDLPASRPASQPSEEGESSSVSEAWEKLRWSSIHPCKHALSWDSTQSAVTCSTYDRIYSWSIDFVRAVTDLANRDVLSFGKKWHFYFIFLQRNVSAVLFQYFCTENTYFQEFSIPHSFFAAGLQQSRKALKKGEDEK